MKVVGGLINSSKVKFFFFFEGGINIIWLNLIFINLIYLYIGNYNVYIWYIFFLESFKEIRINKFMNW